MTFHCACNIDERDCGYPDCNKGRKPLPEYVGTYQAAVSNNEGDKMNIPDGWKLVPEKENHEMRSAFRESEKGALLSGHDHIEAFYCAYRAMLATAPTPAAQEDEPVSFARTLVGPCLVCKKDEGFYGRLAAKKCQENRALKDEVEQLRKAAEEG